MDLLHQWSTFNLFWLSTSPLKNVFFKRETEGLSRSFEAPLVGFLSCPRLLRPTYGGLFSLFEVMLMKEVQGTLCHLTEPTKPGKTRTAKRKA